MSLINRSALELAALLREKKVSTKEVLDAYFAAISEKDLVLNSYISLCEAQAYAQAEQVQQRLDAGEVRSPLSGVPLAVKDLICTKGIRTTCGSRMLEQFVPPYDATVMEHCYAADLILIGKTNMDEFAMGSTTETSAFGATRNPRNPAHVPGGSSGGSAAAVAGKLAPLALGSDTGGSIRQPAAYCGVVGLKPTYGSVSRYGLIAYASSLDQIGPLARTSEDGQALFEIIRGQDPRDATSQEAPPCVRPETIRVGVPQEFLSDALQPEIASAVLAAKEQFSSSGTAVGDCHLTLSEYAIPTYYILACAEASSNLSRYDGVKYGHSSPDAQNLRETYTKSRSEGFGMEVKRRIMLGNFVLSSGYFDSYYRKAMQARRLIQEEFFRVFQEYDVILAPVSPTTAPDLGKSLSDPLKMYLSDLYTVLVNIAGLPALSVPFGEDKKGLPIGLQLIGRPFEEELLFHAAQGLALEKNQ